MLELLGYGGGHYLHRAIVRAEWYDTPPRSRAGYGVAWPFDQHLECPVFGTTPGMVDQETGPWYLPQAIVP